MEGAGAVTGGMWLAGNVVSNSSQMLSQSGGGSESKEQQSKVATYEQARNKALDIVDDLGVDSQPIIGRLRSKRRLWESNRSAISRWKSTMEIRL